MQIFGVILAGGQARRMGGADKAFVALAGRPLIAHVLARLEPQVERVMAHDREFWKSVIRDFDPYSTLDSSQMEQLYAPRRFASCR